MSTSRSFFATVMRSPSPTPFLPIFQAGCDALRERFDVLGARGRHDQDRDLRATLLLERCELGAERVGLRRRERSGLVDDTAGEGRHRNDVLGERGAKYERAEKSHRGKERAHREPRTAPHGLQRDAGFSKLTGGGVEICASLATEKFGLVL